MLSFSVPPGYQRKAAIKRPKPDGFSAADIMITADEIERFEQAHEINRSRSAGPGAPGQYDQDGFHIALFKRVYVGGFPLQQMELVSEMQEWFIADSADDEAPDESTIRRRIKAIWQELNPAQG